MAYPDVQALAGALCTLAGAPSIELSEDERGAQGFHLNIEGVVVNLSHVHAVDPDSVFVIACIGQPPPEHELLVWRALAEANFLLIGANSPVFSRDPVTGDVLLQQAVSLARVDAASLYGFIARLAAYAARWRLDPIAVMGLSDAAVASELSVPLGAFA